MKPIRLSAVCLLMLFLCAVMLQPSACASASLNINKGCNSTYNPNEALTISYQVTASSSATVRVTLRAQMPNGSTTTFFTNRSISPNTMYYQNGSVGSQSGTGTVILEWEADAGPGGTDAGSKGCAFTVASSGGGGSTGTSALRIYNTTSNYKIYLDGAYFATALSSTVTIENMPTGVHQIRLTKSGCEDLEETVILSAGMTTTIRVSMSCGEEPEEEPEEEEEEEEESDDDGDGVTNDRDSCYNPDCSIVDSRGCPKDSDNDGLNDCEDNCPSEYGERSSDGCPEEDSDGDGVTDDQDSCYNPGCNLVDSRGCPWDSDNDGLIDCEDNCPNQAGPRSNNGCAEAEQGPQFCLGTGLLVVLVLFGGIARMKRK